jgi:predicted ATP-grasp superfamily ATP-dependent carboligase
VPLFCGSDDTLSLLQVYREALEPYFILLLNEERLARTLLDKDLFQTLAASRGVSVPRALSWASVGDFDGPVLVKPRVKIAWDSSPMRLQLFEDGAKARVFASGHEVASDPAARQMKDQLLFQEYIPGGDGDLWSFHGFATEEGEVLAWFVGHKLRTYPALTGMSSFLELAHDDELARTGHDVVARLGLQGVFKIDFKKDARTGRFRALEVNARFTLWHHLGARNGINLPLVAYEYLVYGRRPAPRAHETRFRWLCLDLDLRAGRDLASRNELAAAAWLWSILRTRKVYNVFAWSDPRPFFRNMARRARSLRRPPARLFRWLYTAS